MMVDGSTNFWVRAYKCDHKNLYDYDVGIACWGAVGCSATEYHCRDCGVYFTECACGTSNGLSGWSWNKVKRTQAWAKALR